MSRPVYSTRFIASPNPTFPPSYTVPAGFIAVVRDVVVYTAPGAGGVPTTIFIDSPNCIFFGVESSTGGDTIHQELRQVLEPGETIGISSGLGAGCSVMVSGYLLTLP